MNIGINAFTLKMIAIVAMLIDHIGAILFPQIEILRIIGRIAFPIFAFTLVEGFFYTKDVKKYMMRLGILALVSEIPFDLAFFGVPFAYVHQNVFFTLFLGILMLYFIVNTPKDFRKALCVAAMILLADYLRTDYGSWGLLMILCYYEFRDKKWLKYGGICVINILAMGYSQVYAPLALIPIALYNGKDGLKCKKFFYGFYPVHLIVLYIISLF